MRFKQLKLLSALLSQIAMFMLGCASPKVIETSGADFEQRYSISPRRGTQHYRYEGEKNGFHTMSLIGINESNTIGVLATYKTSAKNLPFAFPTEPQAPIQDLLNFDAPDYVCDSQQTNDKKVRFDDSVAAELAFDEIKTQMVVNEPIWATHSDYLISKWVIRFDSLNSQEPIIFACVEYDRNVTVSTQEN